MNRVLEEQPAVRAADLDVFAEDIRRFLAQELSADDFKAKRVPWGIYEQRQDGTFMLRVRVTAGVLRAAQLRELADLSREFGNGLLHVTTRQDVQFHDVAIENAPLLMRRLLAAGLTSKGGGGNTVRNVTACPLAGICPADRFDVTPCAQAVTDYLLPLGGSYTLPRKFKIAFSGCPADCALAQVTDVGFIAECRAGRPGFRVLAGGGMGAHSRIADELINWTPASEIIRTTETLRRLFDQFGDRAHRHKARLRFVLASLGIEEFRRLFQERLAEVIRDGVPAWPDASTLQPVPTPCQPAPPAAIVRDGIRILPHRQTGLAAVALFLPLGDLPAEDLLRLADLAERFSGESGVRTTRTQNVLIRSVSIDDLPALSAGLRALATDVITPAPLNRFVACTGAATCRLGACRSRDAARACAEALARKSVSPDTLADLDFYFNGCPNACGQHPVAALGFSGALQRKENRSFPSYHITLGGRCDATGARFGQRVGQVAASILPDCVCALTADFEQERKPGERFIDYFDRRGAAHFETLVARYANPPDDPDSPNPGREAQSAGR